MNKQQQDAYNWWKENQNRDFDSMSWQELYECCKEQDRLYMLAFPNKSQVLKNKTPATLEESNARE